MNLFRTPFFLPWLYPALHWRVPSSSRKVFLSFDDGPVPGPTEFVAEELAKVAGHATFFCIGENVRKHPEIIRKVVAAGHGVGNHTFNHLKGWQTAVDDYVENVRLCEDALTDTLPAFPGPSGVRYFRPPYGRITRRQISRLDRYRIVMWDVLTHDYASGISAEQCLRGSLAATRPGSVVVFHDSYKAEKKLMYILPRYLQELSEQGYHFHSLPESPNFTGD